MRQIRIIFLLLLGIMFLALFPTHAQETPIITADNLNQLHSVYQFDFADLPADLTPGSGLFTINADASVIVSFGSRAAAPPLSTAIIWDGKTGELLKTLEIGDNTYDRALTPAGDRLLVAGAEGITAVDLATGATETIFLVDVLDPFVEVWLDAEEHICAETASTRIFCEHWTDPIQLFEGAAASFARIGRVPAPLAVTSSEDGLVQRWDMLTNTVTAEAEVGEVAVFGAVNATGSHLAWRDPMSTALYLLDFETGINRKIADLDGGYIAYLLLSHHADVIFGIDPAAERGAVWAWIVATGEQISLGEFRTCERQQPALAELSPDGTTLVIGCDLGLDIWRVDAP